MAKKFKLGQRVTVVNTVGVIRSIDYFNDEVKYLVNFDSTDEGQWCNEEGLTPVELEKADNLADLDQRKELLEQIKNLKIAIERIEALTGSKEN